MAVKEIPNLEFISQTGRTLLTLREMILRGEFAAGERLLELVLSSKLGVSRTPIRLALDRLAHEGLLEPTPSGGFVLRQFTLGDVWDAMETRGHLEGMAARLAAERLEDPAELTRLRALQNQMDLVHHPGIESFAQYMQLNEAFHGELTALSKSPMLMRSLAHVNSLPFASPSALVFARSRLPRASEMLTLGREHHHALIEALEQRQGMRAQFIAWEHARLARRNIESALSDKEILSCVPGASLIRAAPDLKAS